MFNYSSSKQVVHLAFYNTYSLQQRKYSDFMEFFKTGIPLPGILLLDVERHIYANFFY
jgi:hypothetical protein